MSAPTWEEFVEATVEAQVLGFELGYQAGLRSAADELDAEVLRERANKVVRGVVADMGVPAARERADAYPGAVGPAGGRRSA